MKTNHFRVTYASGKQTLFVTEHASVEDFVKSRFGSFDSEAMPSVVMNPDPATDAALRLLDASGEVGKAVEAACAAEPMPE